MSHQQRVLAAPARWALIEPALKVLACSRRNAIDRLVEAFNKSKPLTILVGEEQSSTGLFVGRFLETMDSDVTVVRISGPYSDEISVMRELIHGIGFESKDLSLTDLANVFTLFLSFQKTHRKRTVLCVEESHDCESWLLDRVQCLVELETKEEFGLMVLMSGRPILNELLNHPDRAEICASAEECIALAPFTLAETREYIRSKIESSGTTGIAQAFEFDAITLIHDLSEGAADAVNNLYSKCLELANEGRGSPVTSDIVRNASFLLRAPQSSHQSSTWVESLNVSVVSKQERHLIVRMNDEFVEELALDRGHVLIGRDKLCDILVPSPSVSRHHFLVVNAPNGVTILDLASTNGTFVDGQPVKRYELLNSGVITIGDCSIEYVAGDDRLDWYFDIERPAAGESQNANANDETRSLRCDIKGNINSKGEKIYHVVGSASYTATKIDESKGERWFQSEEEAVEAGWRPAGR